MLNDSTYMRCLEQFNLQRQSRMVIARAQEGWVEKGEWTLVLFNWHRISVLQEENSSAGREQFCRWTVVMVAQQCEYN